LATVRLFLWERVGNPGRNVNSGRAALDARDPPSSRQSGATAGRVEEIVRSRAAGRTVGGASACGTREQLVVPAVRGHDRSRVVRFVDAVPVRFELANVVQSHQASCACSFSRCPGWRVLGLRVGFHFRCRWLTQITTSHTKDPPAWAAALKVGRVRDDSDILENRKLDSGFSRTARLSDFEREFTLVSCW
jgi:hypothetical protein